MLLDFLANQIFCLLIVVLKDLPQHSHKPIVSSILFPALSGLPAIFQVFLEATSLPHVGHFAKSSPPCKLIIELLILTMDKILLNRRLKSKRPLYLKEDNACFLMLSLFAHDFLPYANQDHPQY
jgi:hypothetical protein